LTTVLSLKNLNKNFGKLKAVNDLSLNVFAGNVFGLLGPNGSGKTTTLGMVMQVINRSSGDILWFGSAPNEHTRKKVGAVLEHPIFYPYLSGQQNLELVCLIKKAPKENIEKVLRQVNLFERRHDAFKTYSLGMKQRLSIASALVNDPTVLILDEPTNGLDPQGIAEIRELIKDIAKEGKTIILASHLLDEVQKVCSHFAVLKKGVLIHSGPVADVSKGDEIVEVIAENENLENILREFEGAAHVQADGPLWLVNMKPGFRSDNLNTYLFDKGVCASHIVPKKKSLEKQFLELLAGSNE
jgi:ABC-type multidrug transport system ATPase subunit